MVFSLVSLLFLFIFPEPSSAVFGLSKCERVLKQVKKYESQEVAENRKIQPFAGRYYADFPLEQNRTHYATMRKFVDFEIQMMRFAYNNKKCFSRSQREFIDENYEYVKQLKDFYDSNPFFLEHMQNPRSLRRYPFGPGPTVSIFDQ